MTVEEQAEEMAQKIWLDATRPLLRINERYNLMKTRLIDGLNTAYAEGALEENAKWETWTGQSRHPHPMCKPWYGLLATPEEIAAMKKEKP